MLDMDFVVEHPDVVRRAIDVKGVDLDLDALLRAHGEMKSLIQQVESLRAERNALSKQIASASPEERRALIEQSRERGDSLKDLEPALRDKQEQLRELQLRVPNIPGPDEPVGMEEEENVEERR
jgi:seryl-tRNA synthetase